MTTEEKLKVLNAYCEGRFCPDCIFFDFLHDCGDWKGNPNFVDEAYLHLIEQTTEQVVKEVLAESDPVNHPGHYESGKFECIDVMLETQGKEAVMGFCICNAFKYLYRHKRKNGFEDVKKAQWYLNKYLELAEED